MKKTVLGLALGATLLAAWFAPDDDGGVIAPAIGRTSAPSAAVAAAPKVAEAALAIRRRELDDELGNAFGGGQWQNPSPLKPQAARVQVQQASPAKPGVAQGGPQIQVLGRYIDDGKVSYFLQVGERNVLARVGDKVGDDYHFDSAGPNGLTFTYLPLNQQQVLAAGDIN
jgi:hypothetical protein